MSGPRPGVPQFGAPDPGRDYPDRPAAFAVIERDGQVALVRVAFAGGGGRTDLPGGGLDPGESEEQAAIRECGEEAGLEIAVGRLLVRADHYFVNEEGQARNTRGAFFAAEVVRAAPERKIEADHTLFWADPHEALRALDRESHVWALANWIRKRS
jgi:8-oxo-dGTP diphosphatase